MISKKYETPEDFYKDEREMDLKGYRLTYYKLLPSGIVAAYHPRIDY